MKVPNRQLVLVAHNIREQLQCRKERRYKEIGQRLKHFLDRVEQLEAFRRRLSICEARSWKHAAAKIAKNLEITLNDLPHLLPEINLAVKTCTPDIPSLSEIFQELIQTGEEFGELRYSGEDDVLSVTTEPIELEGVYLGDFEIQLHIEFLGGDQSNGPCRIVALDPHPAAGNESVTHPHVSEEQLCPGDGDASIQMALSSGRVCDFFTMVRSILTTYNRGSPHIHLSEWHGRQCAECGACVNSDEAYYCHSCEVDLCDECSPCCSFCEETNCPSCLQTCSQCEKAACRGCNKECSECGETLCSHCADEGKCPCSEPDEEGDSDEQKQEETTNTGGGQEKTSEVCAEGPISAEQNEERSSNQASTAAG